MAKGKLTAKQEQFCAEYLVDLNATQAATRAGYSKRTANEQGARMLAKASIQEHVQKLMAKRSERTELTVDKVLKDIEHTRELALDAKQLGVATKNSELQGRHLAMFTDKLAHTGEDGGPVKISITKEYAGPEPAGKLKHKDV